MKLLTTALAGWIAAGTLLAQGAAPAADVPFPQPVSYQFPNHPDLGEVRFLKLVVDRDDRVHVLTDRGVCVLVDGRLALDRSYRPLVGRVARDITLAGGEVFYLFDNEFLCNGYAGRFLATLPQPDFHTFAVGPNLNALLVSPTNAVLFQEPRFLPLKAGSLGIEKVYTGPDSFYTLSPTAIHKLRGDRLEPFHLGSGLTALAFRTNMVFVGTRHGYFGLDPRNGRQTLPLQERLPWTEVTSMAVATNGLWVGTTRGVFLHAGIGMIRYFAGRRWLKDDHVIDLQPDSRGDLYVLTQTGLNQIGFPRMTLEQKARFYERKIRQRHIRYGFCAELRLRTPGDPATAEKIDTDNDGTWSSYYLASQAFHFAVTGEPAPRRHAWETFSTLERLQELTGWEGFPARSFERTGFKVSDPERWRPAQDTRWEWKGDTSSDEITAQTFAHAVLYETCARTPEEKNRVARNYTRMVDHILRHNLYLVGPDGQPTLWGRWHPDYVNSYPPTIFDRRLNSAEIISFLQLAFHMTRKPIYRETAYDLLLKHGYLQNITNSMAHIRYTPGHLYQGREMGDVWNHSDDLLAFVTYWTLHRFAFNEDLRRLYAAAILDHWKIERIERNPLWNFILASTGAKEWDMIGALWTLRSWPLDLITWDVRNSHRLDLVRLQPNFRRQETASLLPPTERPMMRWNGNPFQLDGGNGGRTELAGDEFLLPYWMGRYLRLIGAPEPRTPTAAGPAVAAPSAGGGHR